MAFTLEWDKIGERLFEVGVDRCVLYPTAEDGTYTDGAAWNGVTSVNESPSGAEPSPLYADNIKYLNIMSNEDFGFGIEAYTYPDEFNACLGIEELAPGVDITQQTRKPFGFSYRSLVGNDTNLTDYGYKIHLVYGCLASTSDKSNETTGENIEPGTMSWDITTTPVKIDGFKPTAHVVINSKSVSAEKLSALETKLYGNGTQAASLPTLAELKEMFTAG